YLSRISEKKILKGQFDKDRQRLIRDQIDLIQKISEASDRIREQERYEIQSRPYPVPPDFHASAAELTIKLLSERLTDERYRQAFIRIIDDLDTKLSSVLVTEEEALVSIDFDLSELLLLKNVIQSLQSDTADSLSKKSILSHP